MFTTPHVPTQVGPVCEVEVDPGDGTPVTCTEQSLNNTVYAGVLDLLIGVCYVCVYVCWMWEGLRGGRVPLAG